ncbi:MAG: aminopeptidase [Bacteroidales bacterium]|jgi:predicted aminopeptidase
MTSGRTINRKLNISGLVLFMVVPLLFTTLESCQISYLTQAMAGHFRIIHARHPIEKVLKENKVDQKTRDKLKLVLEIHDFAIRELGLPGNKSYTLYAEIKGEYPGWNVYCAPKFSVEPKTWCYPIAGCVVYHGYFNKDKAFEFADQMRKDGYDVYTSPFSAYSTLGWYNDPILSTHLRYDSVQLAGLIIHELAHQEFYKAGDSRYSEGFAVTVERAGVLHWLKSLGRDDQMAEAERKWKENDRVVDRMLRARSDLNEQYAMNRDTIILLKQKDSILAGLESDLKITNRKMNNAWLIPVSTYHSLLPYFQGILDSCGGDFRKFYKAVKI